jgi:hypothetical protein
MRSPVRASFSFKIGIPVNVASPPEAVILRIAEFKLTVPVLARAAEEQIYTISNVDLECTLADAFEVIRQKLLRNATVERRSSTKDRRA